jgi:hypothetical protein
MGAEDMIDKGRSYLLERIQLKCREKQECDLKESMRH